MQDAPLPELEARLSELSQERDHYRKLYLEQLERCALLERGIIAGKKAERFTSDGSQLTLGVLGLLLTPEVPGMPEMPEAPPGVPDVEEGPVPRPAPRRTTGRRAITSLLPRVDIEVLPPEVQREGLDAFERIGEEVSEVVEHLPSSLIVVRIVRPKFVRKRVAGAEETVEPTEAPVLIAEPPERPIERGLAGPGLLAKTIVYRWQDHLPLYRQEKIHGRDGPELARSTMCGWNPPTSSGASRLSNTLRPRNPDLRRGHDAVYRTNNRALEMADNR